VEGVSKFVGEESVVNRTSYRDHRELNRLLSAAIVSPRFCQALLQDPLSAVSGGYYGQRFALSQEELKLVSGIRAQGLQDFAAQVATWMAHNSACDGFRARQMQWEVA
jgi:hypothetical protein